MTAETLAEDGDPLDAMVCVSEPTFLGCQIPVKPIALFKMRDDKGVDDKILCVPLQDPQLEPMEAHLDGSPLSRRADDEPATIRRRLAVYHRQTNPLIPHLEVRGCLLRIDGDGEPSEIRRRLAAAVASPSR